MANAKNGRVHGQISLGTPKISFTQNKNSGTNRGGQTGNTRIAKSISIDSQNQLKIRNSLDHSQYSANAGQTMGIRGPGPRGATRANVAKSVGQKNGLKTHGFAKGTNPTIGLKGAGKPPIEVSRTRTNFQRQKAGTLNTVGLKGAKNGGPTARTRTSLSSPGPRAKVQGGLKTHAATGRIGTKLQSSGTTKRPTGGKGIPLKGNKRLVTSTLRPQKAFIAGIPAQIRRAAARAPSNGSSKPSFTSRVAKIISK